MLLEQTILDLRKPTPPDEHWAIDYSRIQQSNPEFDKAKTDSLLKSIDTDQIVLAEHDHLATVLEMLKPIHVIFYYEARKSQYTKGPPTYYVLIKIEKKEL